MRLKLLMTFLIATTIANEVIAENGPVAKPNAISYGYNSTENKKFYLGEPNSQLTGCNKIINAGTRFARCEKLKLISTYTGHYDYFACLEKQNREVEYLLFNTAKACQADLNAMKKYYTKDLEGHYGYSTAPKSECKLITKETTHTFKKCVGSKPITLESDGGIETHICRTKTDVKYVILDSKDNCEAVKERCTSVLSKYSCQLISLLEQGG